jgi:hypothetical protein
MIEQPFNVGDKVKLKDYYHGKLAFLNDIERNVVSVNKSKTSATGWMIFIDGPNGHYKIGRCGLKLSAGWMKMLVKIEKEEPEVKKEPEVNINTITVIDEEIQDDVINDNFSAFGLKIPEGWVIVAGNYYLEPGDKFYDSTIKKWKTSRAAFSGNKILAGDHPAITYIRKIV